MAGETSAAGQDRPLLAGETSAAGLDRPLMAGETSAAGLDRPLLAGDTSAAGQDRPLLAGETPSAAGQDGSLLAGETSAAGQDGSLLAGETSAASQDRPILAGETSRANNTLSISPHGVFFSVLIIMYTHACFVLLVSFVCSVRHNYVIVMTQPRVQTNGTTEPIYPMCAGVKRVHITPFIAHQCLAVCAPRGGPKRSKRH